MVVRVVSKKKDLNRDPRQKEPCTPKFARGKKVVERGNLGAMDKKVVERGNIGALDVGMMMMMMIVSDFDSFFLILSLSHAMVARRLQQPTGQRIFSS
jgi:hypothetical protein